MYLLQRPLSRAFSPWAACLLICRQLVRLAQPYLALPMFIIESQVFQGHWCCSEEFRSCSIYYSKQNDALKTGPHIWKGKTILLSQFRLMTWPKAAFLGLPVMVLRFKDILKQASSWWVQPARRLKGHAICRRACGFVRVFRHAVWCASRGAGAHSTGMGEFHWRPVYQLSYGQERPEQHGHDGLFCRAHHQSADGPQSRLHAAAGCHRPHQHPCATSGEVSLLGQLESGRECLPCSGISPTFYILLLVRHKSRIAHWLGIYLPHAVYLCNGISKKKMSAITWGSIQCSLAACCGATWRSLINALWASKVEFHINLSEGLCPTRSSHACCIAEGQAWLACLCSQGLRHHLQAVWALVKGASKQPLRSNLSALILCLGMQAVDYPAIAAIFGNGILLMLVGIWHKGWIPAWYGPVPLVLYTLYIAVSLAIAFS